MIDLVPRVFRETQLLSQVRVLTFEEAAELSTFGSKVVHPAAVLPAWQAGVPMSVRNSMAPEDPGTQSGITDINFERRLSQHFLKTMICLTFHCHV